MRDTVFKRICAGPFAEVCSSLQDLAEFNINEWVIFK